MAQTRGIIRSPQDILQVLKTSTGECTEYGVDIKTCYHDTHNDLYCVANVDSTWRERSEISADGWRFIDGTQTLYDGTESEQIPYDNDGSD